MGLEKDLPPGEELVACFRPFIEHLASSSLSSKTIRRHVDNLWILGGEIIRDLILNGVPMFGAFFKVVGKIGFNLNGVAAGGCACWINYAG